MAARFRSVIERAEAFMRIAHVGQKWKTGEPYATHPTAVRAILASELGIADEEAQVAALLHDVAEFTRVPLSEIGERFGPRVEHMVRVLSRLPEDPDEPTAVTLDRHDASLRSAETVVRQIAVADRLHNLREMSAGGSTSDLQYVAETLRLADDVLAGTPGIELLRAEIERVR
jgi:(p)ppGpp synthase/HD superfamily hydrolase